MFLIRDREKKELLSQKFSILTVPNNNSVQIEIVLTVSSCDARFVFVCGCVYILTFSYISLEKPIVCFLESSMFQHVFRNSEIHLICGFTP